MSVSRVRRLALPLAIVATLCVAPALRAGENGAASAPLEARIDTVLAKQDELLKGQARILAAVESVDPFVEKRFAVSLNVPLALGTLGRDLSILSGGLSWFPRGSSFEINLPVWYRSERSDETVYEGGSNPDRDFSGLAVDLQSRWYFEPVRKGFYMVGGLRWAHLQGLREDWTYLPPFYEHPAYERATVDRVGLYGGIGWRLESDRFHWGSNVLFGRYFDRDPQLVNEGLLGAEYLFDIEFFKLGILF